MLRVIADRENQFLNPIAEVSTGIFCALSRSTNQLTKSQSHIRIGVAKY